MKAPLLILLVLLTSGCTIVNEKRTSDAEYLGLWAAPGLRSEELLREELPFYSPTGMTTAYWSFAGGRRDASAVIESVAKYLVDLGYFAKWPKGERGFDDVPAQCIAPYHFFIVSIRPTVVVMASRLGTDPVHGVGLYPTRRNQSAITKYFENCFEYGSDFVDRPELLWFSPDLRVPPQVVDIDRRLGQLRIEHPKVRIRAVLESGIWKTERLR